MFAYIIRRLVYGIVTLFALSLVVFVLIQFSGGTPLDRLKLNPRMQPVIAQLTEQWGLDKPWYEQYFIWLRNFITPVDVAPEPGVTVVLFGKLGIRSWVAVAAVIAAKQRPGDRGIALLLDGPDRLVRRQHGERPAADPHPWPLSFEERGNLTLKEIRLHNKFSLNLSLC